MESSKLCKFPAMLSPLLAQLAQWVKLGILGLMLYHQDDPNFINISTTRYSDRSSPERGLNNYQKRLVHQLIHAEYPDLVTISRPDFVQVMAFEKQREEIVQKNKNDAFEERLANQIGLRWLVEAMADGDLTTIDLSSQSRAADARQQEAIALRFAAISRRLRLKRSVLVGHNIFLDLINFYACFFGKLPDRVEDFQRIIHNIFPMIVDTKYVATHDIENPEFALSSLDELDQQLSRFPEPLVGRSTHFLFHSAY